MKFDGTGEAHFLGAIYWTRLGAKMPPMPPQKNL